MDSTLMRIIDSVARRPGTDAQFKRIGTFALLTLIGLGSAQHAFAQASDATLFVGNNGNLEGSISSLRINADGSLTLIDTLVTGQRDSLSQPCPGCNVYAVSASPSGELVAAGHPSSDNFPVHVSVTRVHSDGTLKLMGLYPVPHSPLDVAWVDDEYLAVARANLTNGNNAVNVYRFDAELASLTLTDIEPTNGFTTKIAVDRENGRVYAQRSSGGNSVMSLLFDPAGQLSTVQTFSTGTTFPLGIGLSPDGTRLYGGGGISNSGNKVVGVNVNPETGALTAMHGSPFISPGSSPKQVVVADNGELAIVGHGSDATVRTFTIDPLSGVLTATGHTFDVGLQGSLGDIATAGDLLFATDNTTAIDGITGVYSFTLGMDGSLIQNGPIVNSGGIAPKAVEPWRPAGAPPCPGDVNSDGTVNVSDLLLMLAAFGKCPGCDEDLNADGVVNVSDLLLLLAALGPC